MIVATLPWIIRADTFRIEGIHEEACRAFNDVLERELSGYRFVAGELVPISSPLEMEEIESATSAAARSGLDGARDHLQTALELFGKKPAPDYRNATKEAISAVESVTKVITGSDSSGLDEALKELAERTQIHRALRAAFSKLYGYTSDESGIRHAILEQSTVGFDEAKFMIVSCSAFVNYLITKASAAGLLKGFVVPT